MLQTDSAACSLRLGLSASFIEKAERGGDDLLSLSLSLCTFGSSAQLLQEKTCSRLSLVYLVANSACNGYHAGGEGRATLVKASIFTLTNGLLRDLYQNCKKTLDSELNRTHKKILSEGRGVVFTARAWHVGSQTLIHPIFPITCTVPYRDFKQASRRASTLVLICRWYVVVTVTTQYTGDIRLLGGATTNQGRVEIYHA